MAGFYPLPAYDAGKGLDFSPVERAVDGWKETNYRNALLGVRQRAETRADEEQGWQREKHQQGVEDRKAKALGTAAQSLLNMPPDQRGRALQAWRMADKNLDSDLSAAGFQPNDVESWAPVLLAKARGVQDPLDAEKTRADINRTNAQADYYRQGGRSGIGSSAEERIAERYMQENPDMTYMEALDYARLRPADKTKRERLAIEGARGGYSPEEIDPWRDRYGVGPNSQSPYARRQQAPLQQEPGANRFDYAAPMRQNQNDTRRRQFLDEARRARAQGKDPKQILQRLQQYGIDATESDF